MSKRRTRASMKGPILLYAGLLAVFVFALEWLEYRYFVRAFSTEIYIVLLVIAFTALGIWVGRMLTPRAQSTPFEVNQAALDALGITPAEHRVLDALAEGLSNKQIAAALNVSPNTIKSHIARLYEKLEAGQRVQAVRKARQLGLVQ